MAYLNTAELQIDLFCRGVRIDPSCDLENDARLVSRTRAGLGSGLEMIIPGPLKDNWLNVPLVEAFVKESPYLLFKRGQSYYVRHEIENHEYRIVLPPQPRWYTQKTSKGTLMSHVGVLQGTYLGIYILNSCSYWRMSPAQNCRFCTTGLNVGVNEEAKKDLEDVVETAKAAKKESGMTFVHFNSGYQPENGLDQAAPYVKAVKERVGALVGVQMIPEKKLWKYDWLIDLGADHFSFCYEFHNPEYFAKYLPGKHHTLGQETFFRALEYTSKKMGKGKVSGEIIAGVEPIEDTLKAIDYITGAGAFPTVCIFRPTIGSDMENYPSPRYEDMEVVFTHLYEACKKNGIPIGVAPNIEVSLIVQPADTVYLAEKNFSYYVYESKLKVMKLLSKPYFNRELRLRKVAEISQARKCHSEREATCGEA
ncbi:MAG: radical SAM protein [Deltaproteobacteria bacterium]